MASKLLTLRMASFSWRKAQRFLLLASNSIHDSLVSSTAEAHMKSTFRGQNISALLNASIWNSRGFCSGDTSLVKDKIEGPAPIDYRSLLQEEEYHKLADSTIHGLLDKLEEYGDSIDIDGFDIDYGNEVLTMKLGDLGTYVINKQTPNRQIWMSSPVSGPSRFDWDQHNEAWIYRRTKANLLHVLEDELDKLLVIKTWVLQTSEPPTLDTNTNVDNIDVKKFLRFR